MISVTLPSLYPEVLVTCVDNLRWTARGKLEIIVVAPFDLPPRDNVLVVREQERRGIAAAHAVAARHATGDYLFPWADDHLMMDGWDEAALAEHEEGRKYSPVFSLGLRHIAPHNNVETIFGMYYPCFPLMLRADVEAIGGWLSADFKAGFSDDDLGLRVWEKAGRCEWSKIRPVRPTQATARRVAGDPRIYAATMRADFDLLCERHEWIAQDWPTEDTSLCNIGLCPEMTRLATDNNTIFCTHAGKFHDAHPVQRLQSF